LFDSGSRVSEVIGAYAPGSGSSPEKSATVVRDWQGRTQDLLVVGDFALYRAVLVARPLAGHKSIYTEDRAGAEEGQ